LGRRRGVSDSGCSGKSIRRRRDSQASTFEDLTVIVYFEWLGKVEKVSGVVVGHFTCNFGVTTSVHHNEWERYP
jgi:hypothetical protein